MYKFIAFALIAAVGCNDLIQGPEGGRKIYDDNKEASPAIWKQKNEVTVKTNDTDVIRRIVITDLRPDKDGEAKIVEGGQGEKNVTIELKSPTFLRGYEFHIEVYAAAEGEEVIDPVATTELSYPEKVPILTEQIPVMENDTKVNSGEGIATESDRSVTQDREFTDQDKKAPIFSDRMTRNVEEMDPIAQYVSENENKTSVTPKAPKSYSLLLPNFSQELKKHGYDNKPEEDVHTPGHHHVLNTEEIKGLKTNVAVSTEPTTHAQTVTTEISTHAQVTTEISNHDQAKTTETSTHTQAVTTEPSTKHDKYTTERNLRPFQDISKELGQNVVFGFKMV